jgi:hypothetical protein
VPGALSDASQRFQPDEGARCSRQDAFTQRVVGIQL